MASTRTDWLQLWFSRTIPIPVGAFAGALALDWAYSASANLMWSNVSAWLLLVGLLGTGAALMVLGLAIRMGRRGGLATLFALIAAFVVQVVNFMIHMRDGWTAVVPDGLVLSIVGTVLILLAAWFGRR